MDIRIAALAIILALIVGFPALCIYFCIAFRVGEYILNKADTILSKLFKG